MDFYSKTCPVLLTSEHTCGTCKITDASAATNLLRPLLLLTPRCLILSFFLVAAPSMTSSPSPFSRAWQTTALSRTPLCKREYGLFDHLSYILPLLSFDLLSPKVICLQHHLSPVCFSLHKHELGCKRNERLENDVLKFQGKIMTARLSQSSC